MGWHAFVVKGTAKRTRVGVLGEGELGRNDELPQAIAPGRRFFEDVLGVEGGLDGPPEHVGGLGGEEDRHAANGRRDVFLGPGQALQNLVCQAGGVEDVALGLAVGHAEEVVPPDPLRREVAAQGGVGVAAV